MVAIRKAIDVGWRQFQAGDLEGAEKTFRQMVRDDCRSAAGWCYLGLVRQGRGHLAEAINHFRRSVQLDPSWADGHHHLGRAFAEKGELDKAVASLRKAVRLAAAAADVRESLGSALLAQGDFAAAADCFRQALRLGPGSAATLNNLACALIRLDRPAEAVPHLERALKLDPNQPHVLDNLGVVLVQTWGKEGSDRLLQQVLALKPSSPGLLNTLGCFLVQQGRFGQAIDNLKEGLRLKPDFAEAHYNLGLAYAGQMTSPEALAAFAEAVRLKPDYAEAYWGLANAYKEQALRDEAIVYYRQCLALQPGNMTVHSALLQIMHNQPDCDAAMIFAEHQRWYQQHAAHLAATIRPHGNDPDPDRRIRLGYLSGDFKWNVMGFYSELVLPQHDHGPFEVFGYANVARPDELTKRLQAHVDHWRPVAPLSDADLADLIRRDGIDLLVDLTGHTGASRMLVMARKPAPVTCTHFGYMDTSGLPMMDYRITDATCDPVGMTERYHTEELIRMPEIMWVYRANVNAEVTPLPALAAGRVTFGVFNGFHKITDPAVALWARILAAVPGSRAHVLGGVSGQADERLLAAFQRHGIPRERVTLFGRQEREAYFRLYQEADLSLDTFPYTGCNTTCDSLWMGVPVVTLAGQTCMARQGASPLAHLGLHDLVCETPEAYVETAVKLAGDLPRLTELRGTLRPRMQAATLTNPERFTRQLEGLYRTMWRNWCATGRRPAAP
jgi:predicted O-linked N-acetylglucosamine transferase (SPINDLY family)